MATIIEKKVLQALEDIYASNSNVITAIQSISVNTNNDDVLAKLQLILTATGVSNTSLSTLLTSAGTTNTGITSLLTSVATTNTSIATSNASLTSLLTAVNSKTPIQKASVARLSEILTAAIPALTPVRLFPVNTNRVGFTIYNNSTNSLYVGPNNSPAGGRLFFQLATNAGPTAAAQCFGPTVWTGEVWVLRNSGTGGVVGYEFEP